MYIGLRGLIRSVIVIALAGCPPGQPDAAAAELELELRYRYELVEQDDFDKDAGASTLRTRIRFVSETVRALSVVLELDDVRPIGPDTYNSTTNDVVDRPIVADPRGTEINQALLRWDASPVTELRLGRQRLTLDNHRFVGNIGWRQNEQTFDGLTLLSGAARDTVLSYGYISNVNRVFGPDDGLQLGDWDADTHLLNARYTGFAALTLSAYLYLMELGDAPEQSNRTVGLRALGERPLGDERTLFYTGEFAWQTDYADSPGEYDARYWLIEAGLGGLGNAGGAVRLGYEVLGGDAAPGRRFVTPLATLHAFQGWADQFPLTPDRGIQDLYLEAQGDLGKYELTGAFHRFAPDDGGGRYGSEIDLALSRRFAGNYQALLKFARYSADELGSDTTKVWLMLSARF